MPGASVPPSGPPGGVPDKSRRNELSSYILTAGALEMPMVTSTLKIPTPPSLHHPLPANLLHCTLFASYDLIAPHPVPFCLAGCPATHARGESSATSKRAVSQRVTSLRKRLGVQIPLPYLGSSDAANAEQYAYLPHSHPRNAQEMTARTGNLARRRRVSLFQAQAKELTGIVSRPLVERVISAIYAGQGIYSRMAIFPAQAVLTYGSHSRKAAASQQSAAAQEGGKRGSWLSRIKSRGKSPPPSSEEQPSTSSAQESTDAADKVSFVKVGMMFATLDLLSPPPRFLESKGPYPKEMNKVSSAEADKALKQLADFDRMTDEQRYEVYAWQQDQAGTQLLNATLKALERRGGIWTEAGRLTTPSSRNPYPKDRARFLVKGVFPERFVNRCKFYRAKAFEPMPNDLDPSQLAKFGFPVVVHTVDERLGAGNVDSQIDLTAFASPADTSAPFAPVTSRTEEEDVPSTDWEWDEADLNHSFPSHPPPFSTDTPGRRDELPTYTSAQLDKINGLGLDSALALATVEREQDFFEGWSIGVTEEPFRSGGWMESLGGGSAAWFVGTAGGL